MAEARRIVATRPDVMRSSCSPRLEFIRRPRMCDLAGACGTRPRSRRRRRAAGSGPCIGAPRAAVDVIMS
jgi:hypothetical protein